LIKKIENLRVSLLPNKNNIISTEFNKNILSNDNPLINILNTSNDNFNKLNNTLMKLFTDKKQ